MPFTPTFGPVQDVTLTALFLYSPTLWLAAFIPLLLVAWWLERRRQRSIVSTIGRIRIWSGDQVIMDFDPVQYAALQEYFGKKPDPPLTREQFRSELGQLDTGDDQALEAFLDRWRGRLPEKRPRGSLQTPPPTSTLADAGARPAGARDLLGWPGLGSVLCGAIGAGLATYLTRKGR